ncbi:LacI family DNA-binding transcriptional regulator [Oerskovia enterophila]|uniref:LacI family DNA-binding transcriptional regulator n=1 Tax=Oerskovia enterophila TaxID=43678 RepID=UPI00339AD395
MRDVAAVAGVSISTVSKALKGTGRMSEETRQRVFDAADRLDFHPNALAQNFALGKSFTVGILTHKAAGTFAMPVITGVMSTLSKHDIAVIVYDDENDPSSRPANIRKLQARRVDGIVVVGDGTDSLSASITRGFAVPVVHAFAVSDRAEDTSLLPDDREAGRLAAEHLLAQGRTRIAHVTAAAPSRAVRERLAGFRSVLDDAGVQLVTPVLHGDWSRAWGVQAGNQLDIGAIDAVFCGNDFIALGLSKTLIGRGVHVPQDVAVVGYDNWSKFGAQDHFLTTVDPLLDVLGQRAAERLVAAADSGLEPGVELLPVELVPGVSSGAIDGSDESFFSIL